VEYFLTFAFAFSSNCLVSSWKKIRPSCRDKISPIRQYIVLYKAIYILNTDCNLVFGQIMLPFIKLSVMIFFTACSFTIIRFFDRLSLISLALASLIGCTAVILLIPTTIVMSNLFKISKDFRMKLISRIQHLHGESRRKQALLLQLSSCYIIRCGVGGLYYMEARAKLTVISKVINGIKFLLVNVKS